MYDSKTLFASVRAVTAACLLVAGAAQAAPVVSISPVSQDLPVGSTTTVDIVVSGLTQPDEAVGGFSLTLGYNDSLLAGVDFSVVPGGAFGAAPDDVSFGFSVPGELDLFVAADENADQATLAGLQGASFVLATVTFEGISAGLSPLLLSNVVLSNWDGSADFDVSSRNGQICVGSNCTVPEPASYALALAALGAAGLARRRPKVVKAV
ncbi:cohesin domain-containing protein [Rubrivivax albus]|uniref:PEP-CTERM sorting domain-containing protein n=1 Tax=Rubrivivax albus TaxID=2499835 RepID=A0A3S2TN00_9BURK|nr:cohesin domain-containing protein [Rubrivivax albus]RVT51716.1 PEP-CTERM sorting domain-containing protein [Rubrivivax albus]